jgi:MFS transporter, DHA2 family, methylenomycin A resistance protein
MCLGQGMILLDVTIVNVALPSIQRELRVTPGNLEWVVNAYVLAFAALVLVGGTLGDRLGRRKVFLAGLAQFTVFSAACALAADDPQLIVFRALQGVGAALMAPLTLSILVDAYPAERRTAAIGIWASAASIGVGAGPVVGGALIELFDWSAVFWVSVPVGLAAGVLTLTAVRESRDPAARGLDPLGAALAAAGTFVLTYGLIETNEHPWTSINTLATLAGAAVLLTAFVAWQRRAPAPMVEPALFHHRRFVAGVLVFGVAYVALAGTFFFMTLYFQNARGWSALETGIAWVPMNLPFLVVTPFAGRIVARLGAARMSAGGMLIGGAGTCMLAVIEVDTPYPWICAALVLIGFGYGLMVPAVSSAAMGAVPIAHAGVGSGMLTAARQLGTALGLAVLGSIGIAAAGGGWTGDTAAFLDGLHAALWTGGLAMVATVPGALAGLAAGTRAHAAA